MNYLLVMLGFGLVMPAMILVMSFVCWKNEFKTFSVWTLVRLEVLYLLAGAAGIAANHLIK